MADCYPDRTRGVALTKFDPYFHPTEDGGLSCRTITDDGQVYTRAISRETAARLAVQLVSFVARDIAER